MNALYNNSASKHDERDKENGKHHDNDNDYLFLPTRSSSEEARTAKSTDNTMMPTYMAATPPNLLNSIMPRTPRAFFFTAVLCTLHNKIIIHFYLL